MTVLKITIPGEPVAAARPRLGRWNVHNTGKYDSYKSYIAVLYQEKYHNERLFDRGVPLVAELHFYRRIQKSISKKEHARRANHEVKPAIKSDIDNYTKSVFDGLKMAWFDDGQIVETHAFKDYDENPRTEIEIREWTK